MLRKQQNRAKNECGNSDNHHLFQLFKSFPKVPGQYLKASAAIVLLLLVAWFIDLGEAISQLQRTDWRWLLPAFAIVQLQIVLSAVRWKVTAHRLGQDLTFVRAVSEYYLATFANLSLPGGVSGDAARVYRNRQTPALSIAIHGVMLERLAGQVALLVICLVGWIMWPALMYGGMPVFGTKVLLSALALVGFVVLLVVVLIRWAPERITRAVRQLGPAMHIAWWSDRQWIVQGVLSLAVVATYMLVFLFASYAVRAPLPVAALLTIVPLVLLSMMIPLSIGGWGIREAAAAVLWPFAALTAESGIATSIVYALVSMLGCLPGLVLLFGMRLRPRSAI